LFEMRIVLRFLAVGVVALTLAGSAEAARVPAGVSSIRFRSAAGITTTYILPGAVKDFVKAFDALPRFVARPCPRPPYTPPDVRIDFLTANGAVVLHAVDHAPGTCGGSITYSTPGHLKYAPLTDDNFIPRTFYGVGDIDPNPRTAANERLAQRDAARLLRLAVVPPGSERFAKPPNKALGPGSGLIAVSGVDLQRIWKVRMSANAVVAFERAHVPAGSRIGATGYAGWGRHHRNASYQLEFSFPAIKHRVTTRALEVNMVSLAPHWTGIRITPYEDWVLAHDPDEVVPGGVRTIEIRKGSRLVHRVTAPRKIATIIRWFDALPVAPPAGPCGPIFPPPPVERVAFMDGTGHVLARAESWIYGVDSNSCNPIEFSVRGHSYPPLLGGSFLVRVEKLVR
jgi:hypothetical protein